MSITLSPEEKNLLIALLDNQITEIRKQMNAYSLAGGQIRYSSFEDRMKFVDRIRLKLADSSNK